MAPISRLAISHSISVASALSRTKSISVVLSNASRSREALLVVVLKVVVVAYMVCSGWLLKPLFYRHKHSL